jgi:hypothetical protein
MDLVVAFSKSDVAFLDEYAQRHKIASRSSVLVIAIQLLKNDELRMAYREAWAEWTNEDENLWSSTSGDGIELIEFGGGLGSVE